ncbi:catechol 1,2-dioxygenase [Ensifer adhaerens]|uniref:dioxygenase family protein n=1 Tax=Ensifer adhaerens TaxID=106592 RepID=UPI001CBB2C39|nr:dioxygenase [Ensifer adhaerens]MBZ7924788.1 catechol 1,2-dioxygenase [Ensifer adhaerens]UAX95991.1 catechol 1,2-dioxygenase [Ensifer adhaerens]UAY04667.1 catechol 1,2-dioxygenase [Ensifer adhaerens]UAY10098.1 catechol 1,2-dioxygenase [Ensifer adhaerens]
MIIENEKGVTEAVLAASAGTESPRLRELMSALVRHLHAFVREARLSEEEFEVGIDFLNRIGQATNDRHNEGILFADILGLSTLVCMLNNGGAGATETAAALLGPFWRMNSPPTPNGGTIIRSATPGPALFAHFTISDPAGKPIEGVEVDVWQASPVGLYENQDASQADMNLRGKFTTDAQGRFWFRSVKPAGYPVPTHGPAGEVLRAQGRHPYRPAHLHVLGFREHYKTLITQIFVDDDKYLESDAVFGVTRHLVGQYEKGIGAAPDADVTGDWYRLNYAFVMEPGEAKLPIPPIK